LYQPLMGQFDVGLIELSEGELGEADQLVDRLSPMIKTGGEILINVFSKRPPSDREFGVSIGAHAVRLLRPSLIVAETHFVPAARLRLDIGLAIRRLGRLRRDRAWEGLRGLGV